MHCLHNVAVEAESKEEAFKKVQRFLLEENNAPWSDWHVVGGGRWSNSHYEDSSENVLGYKDADFKKSFQDSLTNRLNELERIMKDIQPQKILINGKSYLSKMKKIAQSQAPWVPMDPSASPFVFDRLMWRLEQMSKILNNEWTSDSYFYDIETWTADASSFLDRVSKNPDKQWLVPVDFHC